MPAGERHGGTVNSLGILADLLKDLVEPSDLVLGFVQMILQTLTEIAVGRLFD